MCVDVLCDGCATVVLGSIVVVLGSIVGEVNSEKNREKYLSHITDTHNK